MKLEIVWRNPQPPLRAKRSVQRIQGDPCCAVYLVTNPDSRQEVRLLFSQVA